MSASPTRPPAKPRAKRAPAPKAAPIASPILLEDEEPTPNYALRLTEALHAISSVQDGNSGRYGVEDDAPFADVLQAMSDAQDDPHEVIARVDADRYEPSGRRPRAQQALPTIAPQDERPNRSFIKRLLNGFDQMPPVRLPVGPAIPWRIAIPVLVVVVAVMVFVTRSSSSTKPPLVVPTATVQPLFAGAQPDVSATEVATVEPVATPAPQAIGVQEPAGLGFDVLDVGLKLVAVLALAYGSLMLLKRTGFGSGTVSKGGSPALGMRTVSTLVLAPNRTVHLLKVPGGKTLLLGATPNQVNLIADLGALPDDQDAETEGSFFDILKGKISS